MSGVMVALYPMFCYRGKVFIKGDWSEGRIAVLVQQLRASDFVRHNLIFFVGSLAVSVLNYLYYPVLARLLNVEAFGEVQTMVALFTQLTIFLGVIGQVTVNIVANYSDPKHQQAVLFELEKVAYGLTVILCLAVAAFSLQLKSALQFDSVWPFFALLATLLISVPMTFQSSYLRGKQAFAAASISGLIGSAAKIIASAALVAIGMDTFGAIAGLAIAQAIALGYTTYKARALGLHKPDRPFWSKPDLRVVRPELRYSLLVLVGSLGGTVLASLDIFVAKHYFDATTAGQYAGVATVARTVLFLTGSIVLVMLPSIKLEYSAARNRQMLLKSGALVAGLGGAALIAFTVMPTFIIRVLMGASYLPYAHLLPGLSLAMFLQSLLNLFILYHIALRRYATAVIIVLGVLLGVVLMAIHHRDPAAIILNLNITSATLLVAFGAYSLWHKQEQQT